MKRAFLASIGLWLGAGGGLFLSACGAAGGDDNASVAIRENQATDDTEPGQLPTPPSDPTAPTNSTGGPNFNVDDDADDGVVPQGCQQAERSFEPNIPTVYLLVDRSATMFDPIIDNVSAWTALRGGVLEVMRELEGNVRFGFAAFSGAPAAAVRGLPQCLLDVPSVPPALNNFSAISTLYAPLERPTDPNSKETPTLLALAEVADQLRAVTEVGDKYILFVTDGEPDYCDNGNPICPPDSVVGMLQRLSASVDATGAPQTPIKTIVFGISSPTASLRADVLQAFANAGAALPVLPPTQNPNQAPDPNNIYDQCQGVAGWRADFNATGKVDVRGAAVGDYVMDPTLAGTAPVYRPDPTDQAALTDQFRTALAGLKSCSFDLSEDGVQVDLARQDLGERASVVVNGAAVAFDAANGWSMASETVVTLSGTACDAWRDPTIATSISFDFPCDIFVPR